MRYDEKNQRIYVDKNEPVRKWLKKYLCEHPLFSSEFYKKDILDNSFDSFSIDMLENLIDYICENGDDALEESKIIVRELLSFRSDEEEAMLTELQDRCHHNYSSQYEKKINFFKQHPKPVSVDQLLNEFRKLELSKKNLI